MDFSVTSPTPSVWREFTSLFKECGAVNVAQGFPNYSPDRKFSEILSEVLLSASYAMTQYTRNYGHPKFVRALADFYSGLLDHPIDPMSEILISTGAFGSLYYAITSLVSKGDEVILVEPCFYIYPQQIEMVGGVAVAVPVRLRKDIDKGLLTNDVSVLDVSVVSMRAVRENGDGTETEAETESLCDALEGSILIAELELHSSTADASMLSSSDLRLDAEEIRSKITPKTKMIIINNPNNPTGKVFTRQELQAVAEIAIEHDLVVLSDEVYEWLVFPPNQMVRFASLPGMWQRTLTICSAGKMFNVTGWKTGWTIGPSDLMKYLMAVHLKCINQRPTPIQEALARIVEMESNRLNSDESFFVRNIKLLEKKRDRFVKIFTDFGFKVLVPEGTYYILANVASLRDKGLLGEIGAENDAKDFKTVRWLCKVRKLAAIPPSVFYSDEFKHLGEDWIRFCFAKTDDVIYEVAQLLLTWKKEITYCDVR